MHNKVRQAANASGHTMRRDKAPAKGDDMIDKISTNSVKQGSDFLDEVSDFLDKEAGFKEKVVGALTPIIMASGAGIHSGTKAVAGVASSGAQAITESVGVLPNLWHNTKNLVTGTPTLSGRKVNPATFGQFAAGMAGIHAIMHQYDPQYNEAGRGNVLANVAGAMVGGHLAGRSVGKALSTIEAGQVAKHWGTAGEREASLKNTLTELQDPKKLLGMYTQHALKHSESSDHRVATAAKLYLAHVNQHHDGKNHAEIIEKLHKDDLWGPAFKDIKAQHSAAIEHTKNQLDQIKDYADLHNRLKGVNVDLGELASRMAVKGISDKEIMHAFKGKHEASIHAALDDLYVKKHSLWSPEHQKVKSDVMQALEGF